LGNKTLQPLTPLELEIMDVFWTTGPANVQIVQTRLRGGELAYTTVQTMLNVVLRKGRVTRELRGHAYTYRAVFDRRKAVSEAVQELIRRLFNGSARSLVLHLIAAQHI
jgi:BlaI family transcriptional regulator, penicillinase repressor